MPERIRDKPAAREEAIQERLSSNVAGTGLPNAALRIAFISPTSSPEQAFGGRAKNR